MLGFVGDLRIHRAPAFIRVNFSSDNLDQSGLTSSIRTDDPNHFSRLHLSFTGLKSEVPESLLNPAPLQYWRANILAPSTPSEEANRFVANSDVLLREKTIEIGVDGSSGRAWRSENPVGCTLTIHNMKEVAQNIEDCKVVLDH